MIFVIGGSSFIGSHLASKLINFNSESINLDMAPPDNKIHKKFWLECNILDYEVLDSKLNLFKIKFPLNLPRYANLITNNLLPLESTFEELGEPVLDFKEAMARTATWISKARSSDD